MSKHDDLILLISNSLWIETSLALERERHVLIQNGLPMAPEPAFCVLHVFDPFAHRQND